MEAEYYTPQEIAAKLAVSAKTVTNWTQARRVPGQTKVGHLWRYRRTDVDKRLLAGEFLLPRE